MTFVRSVRKVGAKFGGVDSVEAECWTCWSCCDADGSQGSCATAGLTFPTEADGAKGRRRLLHHISKT
jgi:hypothetical protein